MTDKKQLIEQLDDFSPLIRAQVLQALAPSQPLYPSEPGNVNMHCHSFFSYNAHGWSPSRIAWESRRANLYAAALTDFDVLDGLDEFLQAGEMLSLRTAVHLETRAFLNEYSNVDINSPGEPGVTYIMGMGFTSVPASGSRQAETLAAPRFTR